MTVTCRMKQCCYHNENGFCAKPIAVSIDQMGMCSVLWRKGQQRQVRERLERDKIIIDDAEIKVYDSQETENDEEGGSRLEDPQNGDTA